jgi:hypothetical protein
LGIRDFGMSGAGRTRSKTHLTDIAVQFFKKEGYKIRQEDTVLEGYSGISRKFDLVVQKGRQEQGVWIRAWNRTIGVNVIIGLDTASDDVGLSNPIMVGEKFSDHAKSYSNRRKITLLTRQKIISSLR